MSTPHCLYCTVGFPHGRLMLPFVTRLLIMADGPCLFYLHRQIRNGQTTLTCGLSPHRFRILGQQSKIDPLGSHVSNTICRKAMDYSLGPKNPKLFMRFDSTMSFISETRAGYKEWSSALPVSSVFFPDQLPKWSKRKPGPDQCSGQQTGPSQGSELCDPRIVNQQTVHCWDFFFLHCYIYYYINHIVAS